MKLKLFLLATSLSAALAPATVFAATTTGTINATLTLTTGCLVNGQSATSGVNFGTLNFGSSAATFDTLNATLVGASGNGIFVRCTTGQTFNVQVTSSNTAPATIYGTVSGQPRYLILGSTIRRALLTRCTATPRLPPPSPTTPTLPPAAPPIRRSAPTMPFTVG